jgi:flagella basal body P-ring formation protein FlgA
VWTAGGAQPGARSRGRPVRGARQAAQKWHATCLFFSMTHRPPKCRRLLLIACLAATQTLGSDLQDIAQLEGLAKSAAAALLPPPTDRQRLQVGPIQPNLQLHRCENAVQSGIAPGLRAPGRILVELRCEGRPGAAWHLYVPVRIVGTSPVVIAAHALVVGMVLTAKDMTVEQRDITALPPGYLNDPNIAVGLTASRAISGGTVLTNQQLLGTRAVQRGQTVTLIADRGGMSVRMAGRALSDGLINQRIRVENLSSGKIVEGIARSEQVVEIIFQ